HGLNERVEVGFVDFDEVADPVAGDSAHGDPAADRLGADVEVRCSFVDGDEARGCACHGGCGPFRTGARCARTCPRRERGSKAPAPLSWPRGTPCSWGLSTEYLHDCNSATSSGFVRF